jgi:hypothetical protein
MRFVRFFALIALLMTLPVYGMAAGHVRACAGQIDAAQSSEQGSRCCPDEHGDKNAPCEMPGKGTPCAPCKLGHCASSVQALERAPELISILPSSTVPIVGPVTTLLTADSPDGLWRPPRAV